MYPGHKVNIGRCLVHCDAMNSWTARIPLSFQVLGWANIALYSHTVRNFDLLVALEEKVRGQPTPTTKFKFTAVQSVGLTDWPILTLYTATQVTWTNKFHPHCCSWSPLSSGFKRNYRSRVEVFQILLVTASVLAAPVPQILSDRGAELKHEVVKTRTLLRLCRTVNCSGCSQ